MGLAQRAEVEKIRSCSNIDISSKEVAARLANDRIGASAKESLQRTVTKCAPLCPLLLLLCFGDQGRG